MQYIKQCMLVLALALLGACAPMTPPDSPESLSGVWVSGDTVYCLDSDYRLGLPGQQRSGLNWRLEGNELVLITLTRPGSQPQEERFTVKGVSGSRLAVVLPSGEEVTWRKDSGAAGHLDGMLVYRERMALPPEVLITTQLFSDPEGAAEAQPKPVAASINVSSGQGALPFRLHYLTSALRQIKNPTLRAGIWFGPEQLFATAEPVPVDLHSGSVQVLVNRSFYSESAGLSAPAQYGNESGTLFLEKGGVYLWQSGKSVSLGRWQQVDRNHSVELLRGAQAPWRAAIRPDGALALHMGAQESRLSHVEEELPATVRVSGMLRYLADAAVLETCTGALLPVEGGPDYMALEKAGAAAKGKPVYVEFEAALKSRPAGSEGRPVYLEVLDFGQARPGKTCPKPWSGAALDQTYWRLISLDGKASETYEGQAEPHLILRGKGEGSGSDGCNNFFLSWKKESGSALDIMLGGSTLMLCPQGDEQARRMMQNLDQAARWQISGSVLELKDKEGNPLAAFEAVAL